MEMYLAVTGTEIAKLTFLTICALSSCAVPSATLTPRASAVPASSSSDAPKFRDLTFRQASSSDMMQTAPDSGMPCYSRSADDLSTGSGTLASLNTVSITIR